MNWPRGPAQVTGLATHGEAAVAGPNRTLLIVGTPAALHRIRRQPKEQQSYQENDGKEAVAELIANGMHI